MSSAPHDPFRLPVRILAIVGLAGLATLTLVDRGVTRMFAPPWIWLLTATLAARIRYDIFYIENWSPWFDGQILLLTFARWKNVT